MAVFASIFAMLGRVAGRFLNMTLGWATILLFGRVPDSKQLLLSLISLGSLAWVAVLVGVIFPDVGLLLLAAVPSGAVSDALEPYVRLILLAAAIVIPLLVGVGGYLMLAKEDRPTGGGLVKQVLRGYPYAAALAVTLAFLTIVAPLRKLRSLAKRWQDAHIPVVVKPGGYERVADDLEHALDRADLGIDRRRAPRVLEIPSKFLAAVGGTGVGNLVPDRLIVLGSDHVEVLIHPSDVSIAGRKQELARARAAVASRLTFTAAYLTSTAEAQEVEDRLARIAGRDPGVESQRPVEGSRGERDRMDAAIDELAEVDHALETLVVPYEEWEVLYRLRLQVERDLLARRDASEVEASGAADHTTEAAGVARAGGAPESVTSRLLASARRIYRRSPFPRWLAALRRAVAQPLHR